MTGDERSSIHYFRREIIRRARELPLCEARQLLHGALILCGEHEDMEAVRDAYIPLCAAENQLELLLTGPNRIAS